MPPEFDCQTCGACCTSRWTGFGYVRLYDIDLERLRGTGLPVVHQEQLGYDPPLVIPKLGTAKDERGRRKCVAFEATGETCRCTIYPDRPEACRLYEAGSTLCREARERVGLLTIDG